MQVSLRCFSKMKKWPSLTRKHFYRLFDFEFNRFRHSSMSNLFHCCSKHLQIFASLQIDIGMKFLSGVFIGNVECFPSYKGSYFCLIMKFYYRLSHFATQDVKYISLTIFSSNAFASVVTWSEVPSQMSTFPFLPILTY